ncbi:MAG: hypothetical protein EBR71_10330, partial [Planctomycetes bacterium]|nr:hypothetical protein [Planctomycetota bacterium]
MMHAVGPVQPPADLIDGAWLRLDGVGIESRDPANPDRVIWSGAPRVQHVDRAVDAARRAFPAWRALGFDARAAL